MINKENQHQNKMNYYACIICSALFKKNKLESNISNVLNGCKVSVLKPILITS